MLMAALTASAGVLHAKTLPADKVFDVWVNKKSPAYQAILQDVDFRALGQKAIESLLPARTHLEKNKDKLGRLGDYLIALSDAALTDFCRKFMSIFDADITQLRSFFEAHGFTAQEYAQSEARTNYLRVINRYNILLDAVLSCYESKDELIALKMAVGNRLLDMMIDTKSKAAVDDIIADENYHTLMRFIFSVVWQNLSGEGWKWWHQTALKRLAALSTKGTRTVYIGGGCDIHHLIQAGVYNITVIDPMLPSQPKYYVDEWSWFIQGDGENKGMGDVISFDTEGVQLRRSHYQLMPGRFQVTLADGSVKRLRKSVTTWTVEEIKTGKLLGTVVFERRLCGQDDFKQTSSQRLLMSFNELYYVCTANKEDSWGINLSKLSKELVIEVKQARHALTLDQMQRLHEIDGSDDFQFIKLGTCIN